MLNEAQIADMEKTRLEMAPRIQELVQSELAKKSPIDMGEFVGVTAKCFSPFDWNFFAVDDNSYPFDPQNEDYAVVDPATNECIGYIAYPLGTVGDGKLYQVYHVYPFEEGVAARKNNS